MRTAGQARPALRPWTLAWLGGPVIGIANGVAREKLYKDRVGDLAAHQISTASALLLFAGYFRLLERWRPISSQREAFEIGAVWAALTMGFEFGFGHYVAHEPWEELLADYNLKRGRVWGLVMAWMAAGPSVVRAVEFARAES